ncbi:MAG TPA: hypothetical protein VI758_10090 [Bacteroidota bacterium]
MNLRSGEMSKPHNPFRVRRVWWVESGFFLVSLAYLGIGAIFILWISYLEFPIAAQVLGILWIIMYVVIILMYKRILSEPNVYVKGRVVRRTTEFLQRERIKERNEFVQRELAQVKSGERTAVLDIWKTDPQLAKRHSYFSETRAILIDPTKRECHIRISWPVKKGVDAAGNLSSKEVLSETIGFLKTISTDGFLRLFSTYFDSLIVVIDRLESDERGGEVAIPMLSILLESESFWKIAGVGIAPNLPAGKFGDLRFDEGREIEPHRTIELAGKQGAK